VNDAKREGSTLRDKLRRAVDALDLGEIEDFDLFKTHARSAPTRRRVHELNLEVDPLAEYLSATRTTPAPAPHSVSPGEAWDQEPSTTAGGDSVTLETPRTMPASGPIPRDPGELDTYTKLADAFLNSSSDSTRRRIARRLDVAQNSDSAVIREHASQAIGRIHAVDASAFEHALTLEPEQQLAKG